MGTQSFEPFNVPSGDSVILPLSWTGELHYEDNDVHADLNGDQSVNSRDIEVFAGE